LQSNTILGDMPRAFAMGGRNQLTPYVPNGTDFCFDNMGADSGATGCSNPYDNNGVPHSGSETTANPGSYNIWCDYCFNAYQPGFDPEGASAIASGFAGLVLQNSKPIITLKSVFAIWNPATGDTEAQRLISSVTYASDTWMAWDGAGTYHYSASTVAFRHPGNSANFLYFDGHVEQVGISQIAGYRDNTQSNALTPCQDIRMYTVR
jgi:prepilin-type processing-associated H-X9-DG protein